MARLDALKLGHSLKDRLLDFTVHNTYLRDQQLRTVADEIWGGPGPEGGLVSDLWIEAAIPAKAGEDTLGSLVDAGLFPSTMAKHLAMRGVFPPERRLFTHQTEALRLAQEPGRVAPGLMISSGTGSGKTEAFLLPLIQRLMATPRLPDGGVKAFILYPMNALVNDQLDRLYEWLRGQDWITFIHFTSETPENRSAADSARLPVWEKGRMRTRYQARGLEDWRGRPVPAGNRLNVPDIIITNYSMLEYMLCRPQDRVFFGKNLTALVLDEAHLYAGSLAAEMTLLVRRLMDKCAVEPAQVLGLAASATVAADDPDALKAFAANLLCKDVHSIRLVSGQDAESQFPPAAPPLVPPAPTRLIENSIDELHTIELQSGQEVLRKDAMVCDALRPLMEVVVAPDSVAAAQGSSGGYVARFLHQCLAASPIIHRLDSELRASKYQRLDDLTVALWGTTGETERQATTLLLTLAASARTDIYTAPCVPHKLHLMVRPAEGLTCCLNGECGAPASRRWEALGAINGGLHPDCGYCGGFVLSLLVCPNCGQPALGAVEDKAKLRNVLRSDRDNPTKRLYSLAEPFNRTLNLEKRKESGSGGAGLPVQRLTNCPHCDAPASDFSSVSSDGPLPLSITTETLLAELPELPGGSNDLLPARGRRLLAFSDSRTEAARLGPRLRVQHEQQMIRSILVRTMASVSGPNPDVLEYYRKKIQESQEQISDTNTPAPLRPVLQEQLARMEREYAAVSVGEGVQTWADRLLADQTFFELLDPESGAKAEADTWNQEKWERNHTACGKKALSYLGRELATVQASRSSTAETVGFVEVMYPGLATIELPPDLAATVPTPTALALLRGAWHDLLASLCDTLRGNRCITLGDALTDWEWSEGVSVPIGRWMHRNDFVGVQESQARRVFIASVLRQAGLTVDEAREDAGRWLDAIFTLLLERAVKALASDTRQPAQQGQLPWVETMKRQRENGQQEDAVRLIFPELALRRPEKLYECSRTLRIWPRSVLGCAPRTGCTGTLREVGAAILDASPVVGRSRREYQQSRSFTLGLWAEEHSAQLSPAEARRLQELFKKGIRNILSATTTLELGIDIGGLNGVLMSNVPPGKANYQQRAGRVGRRADGSSIVVTYARSRPYDREVFLNIGQYLGKPHRKPSVLIDRDRIVLRHFHAWITGLFFEQLYLPTQDLGAMQAFGHMGPFCGVALPDKWDRTGQKPKLPDVVRPLAGQLTQPGWWETVTPDEGLIHQFVTWIRWLRSHPLDERYSAIFHHTPLSSKAWEALLTQALERFAGLTRQWRDDYQQLMEAWESSTQVGAANSIRYRLKALYDTTVIETLAEEGFLPRYGFPIGLQKLMVNTVDDRGRVREEGQYRLERPGMLALREYVPGSQLLVGGKLVTSRGLLKHWSGANLDDAFGLRGSYTKCIQDHFYYSVAAPLGDCPLCLEPSAGDEHEILFPRHGFSTAAWDPPRFSSDVETVGRVEVTTVAQYDSHASSLDFAGVAGLKIRYQEEGQLLVYNNGDNRCGFAICTKCGYAESEDRRGNRGMKLPRGFERHAPLYSKYPNAICWEDGQSPALRNQTLGAQQATDIVLIQGGTLCSTGSVVATTMAVALQIAGSRLLSIDSREVGCLIVPVSGAPGALGIVLYDNVPGGAGHVHELMDMGRQWLETAQGVLTGTPDHDARCKSACLDCIMTFEVQVQAQLGLLDRKPTLEALQKVLRYPVAAT